MIDLKKYLNCLLIFLIILITKNVSASEYDKYLVESNSTSNYTINLFDYWIHESSTSSDLDDPQNLLFSGINNNHLLIFHKYGTEHNQVEGTWNLWRWPGYYQYSNMVSYKLDSTASPYLIISDNALSETTTLRNRQNESLDYLFDPNYIDNSNRLVYTNVMGLLQNNNTIGDYYSSIQNFAYFDKQSNKFQLFNISGVERENTTGIYGQFFPFNSPSDVFEIVDNTLQNKHIKSSSSLINHYFGLTIAADFTQPQNGQVPNEDTTSTKDMLFTISGDDDIWLYIDNYLYVDIGGIHNALKAEINFATGQVTISPLYDPETITTQYYLGEIIENNSAIPQEYISNNLVKEIDENGNIKRYTFKDYTTHSLKLFYLERGNYESNLIVSFYPSINGYQELEDNIEQPIANPNTYDEPLIYIVFLLFITIISFITIYIFLKYPLSK